MFYAKREALSSGGLSSLFTGLVYLRLRRSKVVG